MERLWAPWRMEYITDDKFHGCIFCSGPEQATDRERLILWRSPLSLVMMNRYPYSNGHLMVSPNRHTADLNTLSAEEMLDLFETLRLCRNILQENLSPQGFNIGLNLGRAAGAGIEEHLHFHIVPRWGGDANFMTVVAEVRVIPEHLLATYDKLLPAFCCRQQ